MKEDLVLTFLIVRFTFDHIFCPKNDKFFCPVFDLVLYMQSEGLNI